MSALRSGLDASPQPTEAKTEQGDFAVVANLSEVEPEVAAFACIAEGWAPQVVHANNITQVAA